MVDIDKNSIRMILTMAEESNEKWRVNKLCERLELEKYEVSKKVTRLAEKGLIDKSDITDLKLTEAGMAFAVSFSDRLRKVTTHLEYEGMDSEAAARNAFNIAMYCDNDYFDRFDGQFGEMSRIKELYWNTFHPFSGADIERNLKPGTYELSFMTYRNNVVDHLNFSMAKGGFHNSCKLLVDESGGYVLIRIKEHEERSLLEKRFISGKISELKYFDGEGWVPAIEGLIVRIPLRAFTFFNIGGRDVINGLIQGCVEIASKVEYGTAEHKHNIPDHAENDGYMHCIFAVFLR